MNLVINKFAERHTADSEFSHYDGPVLNVIEQVLNNWDNRVPGDKQGTWVVTIDPTNWFSGVVILEDGDKLQGQYKRRHQNEKPRKHVTSVGRNKLPAKHVDIIVWESKALGSDYANLPLEEGNYEIVSMQARTTDGPEPLDPYTLMANFFEASGGTRGGMTVEQFVHDLRHSFFHWDDKVMCG